MAKRLGIFIILALVFIPGAAKADFEVLQGPLEILKVIQDKASLVLQKYNAARNEIIKAYEGFNSALNKAQGALNNIRNLRNSLKTLQAQVNPMMQNINDSRQIARDIEKNYLLTIGGEDQTQRSQQQDIKVKAIQAENIANLFAKAITTRVNIDKEKAEDQQIDRSNKRELTKAINSKAESISQRYTSLWNLDTTYREFVLSNISNEFAAGGDEDGTGAGENKSDNQGEKK